MRQRGLCLAPDRSQVARHVRHGRTLQFCPHAPALARMRFYQPRDSVLVRDALHQLPHAVVV
eukprot:9501150-Pyramimonas_sp.AAC.1